MGKKRRMNIVCALTFDAAEDATLASAASLARMLSAQLTVVHVLESWWSYVASGMITEQTTTKSWFPSLIDVAEMDTAIRQMLSKTVQVQNSPAIRIVRGERVNTIVQLLREVHGDLLVISALRKRAWWLSVPHDSRIRQLIESVDCPVMVIPHGGTFTAHGNRRSGKKGNR